MKIDKMIIARNFGEDIDKGEIDITLKTASDLILNQADNRYVMGCTNPVSTSKLSLFSSFSGSDICVFFDEYIGECLSITFTKASMRCIFSLSERVVDIMTSDKWLDVNAFGFTETGKRGLISGKCKPIDFRIHTSIDELNVETSVDFEFKLNVIKGWLYCSKETDKEIGDLYKKIRHNCKDGNIPCEYCDNRNCLES